MAQSIDSPHEEDEDDYLTMTFEDPTPSATTETLTQKQKRMAREAEIKGRPKSKAEIAAEERKKRDAALASDSMDTSSKGFKMMAALGYKPGMALGAERDGGDSSVPDTRLREPVGLEMKEGRSGIGADTEKKRKIREQFAAQEDEVKKRKVEEVGFRERQQKEREGKRMEGQLIGAQKVCERLEEEEDASRPDNEGSKATNVSSTRSKPLSSINLLWRGIVKHRLIQERDRRMKYDLHQSQTRRPLYDDPDEDKDDQMALSRKSETEEAATDIDEDDEDLEAFEALPPAEKLQKVVDYLRKKWHYCFWCKFRYLDEAMEGCPGTTEEDHD